MGVARARNVLAAIADKVTFVKSFGTLRNAKDSNHIFISHYLLVWISLPAGGEGLLVSVNCCWQKCLTVLVLSKWNLMATQRQPPPYHPLQTTSDFVKFWNMFWGTILSPSTLALILWKKSVELWTFQINLWWQPCSRWPHGTWRVHAQT